MPFVWYALADLWQALGIPLASVVVGEAELLKHGPPLWADPSFRIPLITMVILTCYGLLVKRLWGASARPATIT